ncbi:MAG: cytochrome c [Chitinophagaceae bacterium]|nr:MAG: cytochrome c [Chitinophagaceae bacterium]
MNQSRYILTASFVLLAAWSLFWVSEKVAQTAALNQPAPAVATATAAPAANAPAAKAAALPGKAVFAQNCAACHSLDKNLTGPALAGFTGRGPWSDRKKVYAWVHNPAAFMAKDAYTKDLQKQYGAVMMAFPQLSEKDIDQIVEYIEAAGS